MVVYSVPGAFCAFLRSVQNANWCDGQYGFRDVLCFFAFSGEHKFGECAYGAFLLLYTGISKSHSEVMAYDVRYSVQVRVRGVWHIVYGTWYAAYGTGYMTYNILLGRVIARRRPLSFKSTRIL